jgi:hypothetical protein
MGTLMFECPTDGTEIFTGLEMDYTSFEGLSPHTIYLPCPHCSTPHLLGEVRAWLSEKAGEPPERPTMHLAWP